VLPQGCVAAVTAGPNIAAACSRVAVMDTAQHMLKGAVATARAGWLAGPWFYWGFSCLHGGAYVHAHVRGRPCG
jgi:hypothetical protein